MISLPNPQKVTISKKGLKALYIQRRNGRPGYWFSKATWECFGTRILPNGFVMGERVYFITSDLSYDRSARIYSIRYINADGDIRTSGGGAIKYYTASAAKVALWELRFEAEELSKQGSE